MTRRYNSSHHAGSVSGGGRKQRASSTSTSASFNGSNNGSRVRRGGQNGGSAVTPPNAASGPSVHSSPPTVTVTTTGPVDNTLRSWESLLLDTDIPAVNRQIYEYLAPVNRDRLARRLRRLQWVKSQKFSGPGADQKRGRASALIDKLFEHLVRGILQDCKALKYVKNLRTTTAEIDFLIQVEPIGFGWIPMLKEVGNHLIGEAKLPIENEKRVEWKRSTLSNPK